MIELSVLIVNYNSWSHCVRAVKSLADHPPQRPDGTAIPLEVIVVDNDSPIREAALLEELRRLVARLGGQVILHHENGGYGKGMNLAYRHARGSYIVVSNPDVIYQPHCLTRLAAYLDAHADCGAAAPEGFWDEGLECKLPANILPTLADLFDLTLAHLGPRFVRRYSRKRTPAAIELWTASGSVDLEMFSGCCFMMKRALIEKIRFFDERFPLYFEDTDLSRRIRKAGMRIVQVAGASLVHLYNRSGQTEYGKALARHRISKRRYYRKWYGPVGEALFALALRVQESALSKRITALPPRRNIQDLPPSASRPTIHLPRDCRRFVVEIAMDPWFLLAAGVLSSGATWTPGAALFANFPEATYFRVLDLSNGIGPELGVYRFERLGLPGEPAKPRRAS